MRVGKWLPAFVLIMVLHAMIALPALAKSGTSVSATVTTAGNSTATYSWTLAKSASPTQQNVTSGNSGSVLWTIGATKSAPATAASFSGQVCVTNTGAQATQNLAIQDQLFKSSKLLASVPVNVSPQPGLNAGQSYCYPYTITVPASAIVAGATYKDTAVVTITNKSGSLGTPAGTSASASAALPPSPTVVNATINVTDTNGMSFTFSASGSQSYSQTYACSTSTNSSTILNNTATITQTGQTSKASATITCTPRTVSGVGTTIYPLAAAVQPYLDMYGDQVSDLAVPIDYSSASVEALIPDGNGGLTSYPGTGTATGTFSIPGVPPGQYMLHVGGNYYVNDSNSINLSTAVEGRTDAVPVPPASWSTTLTDVSVGNLDPWQTGDTLEFFAPTVNDWSFGIDVFANSGAPNPGDTYLSNLTFNESAFSCCGATNAIDASKGDVTYLTQLSARISSAALQYLSLVRVLTSSSFTQTVGATTNFGNFDPNIQSGTAFTDVSTSNPTSLTFKTTQFASALSSAYPSFASCATQTTVDPNGVCFANLYIVGIPFGSTPGPGYYGLYGSSADFLILQLPTGGGDVNTGTMFYGTPLSTSFDQFLAVSFGSAVSTSAPGATSGRLFFNGLYWAKDVSGLSIPDPITPPVSSAQSIKVNGSDFFSDQQGVGSSPTVSWSAPAIGTPSLYQLTIRRIWRDDNGGTRIALVANVFTPNSSVVLPGLLTQDPSIPSTQSFVITLTAISGRFINVPTTTVGLYANTPLLDSPDAAYFFVSSGVLTP